jgi:butyrate kinase
MFTFITHRGTTLDVARTDQLAAVAQVSRVPERPRSSIMHAAALARRRAMLCPQNRAGDQAITAAD